MEPVNKNPWGRRRTTLEKVLITLCTLAVIVIIALVIGLVAVILPNHDKQVQLQPSKPTKRMIQKQPDSAPVCFTPECVHAADMILQKMKLEVDPCTDFYQFACGKFIESSIIPEDELGITSFTGVYNKLQEQLKDIITEERPATDPEYLRIPNRLYKTCMNTTLIESLGAQPIREIAISLGDWPVIKGDDWDLENKWTWVETIRSFRQLGFSHDYIIDVTVIEDLKNTSKRIVDCDQSMLGLNHKYLSKGFNDTLVKAYYDYMVDIAVLFGANRERAVKELRESLEFEIGLANISWSAEKLRNPNNLYNPFTIPQLQEKYPYIQWLDYINGLLPEGVSIEENEVINLAVTSFYDGLGPLLANTPKRVIANYLMWRMHRFAISFISKPFRQRELEYTKVQYGTEEREARWKECVSFAAGNAYEENREGPSLPLALSSLYVRKYFDNKSKDIASELVENIRAAFSLMLDELDWMDAKTKEESKKKLDAMKARIGYPDELLDDKKLAEYYEKLKIDEEKYFRTFLNLNRLETDDAFKRLPLPVNKTDWVRFAKPADVNAYFSPIENSIHFPAGILQNPFFHAKRPQYLNYGSIGFFIGHEITHGFDDQGKERNADGNLANWWLSITEKLYFEKARCIIEQYGNLTDSQTGLKLNGINTQGENIADNGGIKEAYRAYKKWVSVHGPEKKLPGLDYTPEQLLWISTGQTWCSKYRTEALKNVIIADAHPPSEFRAVVPLANNKDFAKDFNCPEGTPMNPMHRCVVW